MALSSLEPIVNLAKRRGFIYPSAEVYGGTGGVYDLGPLGVELANNIKQAWWQRFVRERDDMVGLDAAILTPASVLKASGHVDSFSDPLIECSECHIRLRADHYLEEDKKATWLLRFAEESARQAKRDLTKADHKAAEEAAQKVFDGEVLRSSLVPADLCCPNCKKYGTYGEPRQFNMMFQTQLGAVEGEGSTVYLRPETAQGIFVNFKQVLATVRQKLPFGIAQIGKAFRNEITVGNSLFRVREFEQMEIEYFVRPGEDEVIHQNWIDDVEAFLTKDMGITAENLRQYEHPKEKLSHYSKRTIDFEYLYPGLGFAELYGVANRTDYDLKQHQEFSAQDMSYFDEETREKIIPYVIEPSVGVGRLILAVLTDAYKEYPQGRDGQSTELETVLHIAPKLAPVTVAVLPLMKKDGLAEKAREIHAELRKGVASQYDEGGAIGRRYRRQDEIGTPWCVTVDYQTLEDGTVTLRNRDSMQQERMQASALAQYIYQQLH